MEIFGIVTLAVFIEGFVEYFVSSDNKTQPWLKYVSLMLGVIVAFFYQVDIFAMLGLMTPFPYVGNVISGILIGRGGNFVNDFMGMVKSFKDTTR